MRKRWSAKEEDAAARDQIDPGTWRAKIEALDGQYGETGDLEDLRTLLSVTRAAASAVRKRSPERTWCLFTLGNYLQLLYLQTGDEGALTEAVRAARSAVVATPQAHPERGLRLSSLARGLHLMFDRTKQQRLLREAVTTGRAAVAATSDGNPGQPICHVSLVTCLLTLAEQTGDTEALQEAAALARTAIDSVPDGDPLRSECVFSLAACLRKLFDQTGDADVLAETIMTLREGLAESPARNLMLYQVGLGDSLDAQYKLTEKLDTLAESVDYDQAALTAMTEGHFLYERLLPRVAANLVTLSERTNKPDMLAEAVTVSRANVAVTPVGHPKRATRLSNLAVASLNLFNSAADADALAEGVAAARAAVAASSPDDPDHAWCLCNLGGTLQILYEQTADLETLIEAVDASRAAAIAIAEGHPDRGWCMSVLGTVLGILYGRTGDLGVLTEGVAATRAAIASTADFSPDHPRYLTNLGAGLLAWYGRTGESALLTEAVEVSRAAVDRTEEEHPDYLRHLSTLGASLQTLYAMTGDLNVLTEAVDVSRTAATAVPDDSPERARYKSNLGIILQVLYARTEELAALTEAVEASRAAATAAPTNHLYGLYLSNLAYALTALYRRTRNPDTLAEAEETSRAAVDALEEDQPYYLMSLANLSIILSERFRWNESLDALTEAVAVAREAAAAVTKDDPNRARYLSNLCMVLRELFEQNRDLGLLVEAVAAGRATVTAELERQADYAVYATNYGIVLGALFGETEQAEALSEARDVLAKAARSPAAPITIRILASLERARLETAAGEDMPAAAAVEDAVRLMPLAASGELRRQDQEFRLGAVAGIGAIAAATALSIDNPDHAVELLEQVRGQLLAEAMDLNRLREHAPDLAIDFERTRAQFSLPAAGLPPLISAEEGMTSPGSGDWQPQAQAARQRLQTASDDTLLDRIRAHDGLEDFLATPSISQLRQHASAGPIVMITAAWNRSDALIVTDDPVHPVQHVPLPDLTQEMAYQQVNRLRAVCDSMVGDDDSRLRAEQDLHAILAWLWDTTTGPVLAALGHTATRTGDEAWPRLWWCPVGTLAFLPMHAAGHHHDKGADRRTVLDRVVSSYTATIRSLAYSRQGSPRTGSAANTSLIVAMPDTPGAGSLLGVRKEIGQLARLLPNTQLLQGPDATHDSVIKALPKHRVAHFACHGLSDSGTPGASRLLLYDHQEKPLTVEAISRVQLSGADLAYLSACSTSATSSELADEAVHITSAFQLAGYRNVIGTLWPADDRSAVRIAAEIYAYLTSDGTHAPDTDAAAVALHRATRTLREDFPGLPTRWAAYIHTGA
jgi:tetratricopeptide (TPR) repeat protein